MYTHIVINSSYQERGPIMNELKTTPALRRAIAKYQKEKTDTITIHVPKGRKSLYRDAAAAAGKSLNQFAIDAMDEKIERNMPTA